MYSKTTHHSVVRALDLAMIGWCWLLCSPDSLNLILRK